MGARGDCGEKHKAITRTTRHRHRHRALLLLLLLLLTASAANCCWLLTARGRNAKGLATCRSDHPFASHLHEVDGNIFLPVNYLILTLRACCVENDARHMSHAQGPTSRITSFPLRLK